MSGVTKGDTGEKPMAKQPIVQPVKQPKQPASPGALKTSIEPQAKVTGPPIPALQQHGYHGSINDFNQRVQAVHDAYQKSYGTPPSPSLTLDLAKSPVQVQDFIKMFQVPISKFSARSRGALTSQGIVAPTLHLSAKDVSNGILEAAKQGDYQKFIDSHIDQIHDLTKDPRNAALITGAVFRARRIEAFDDTKPTLSQAKLKSMGFVPTDSQVLHPLSDASSIFGRAVSQVTDSLVHSPAGIYELGKAIGLDTRDIVVHPASHHFTHTAPLAKGVVKATVQDVEHPGQNPGYLFLDILGFASPLAGGAARAGEAGRLAKAGELAGAAKALVKKPPLRRVTLRHGDLTEEMPLSQNPLVAAAQKFVVNRRQAAADKRLAGEAPAGIRSIVLPQAANDLLDEQLSFETKIGREADARKRIDHIVKTTLSRELDHVAGRAVTQARIQAAVPSKIRGALTRGEQKAIQVMSWDDPNPLQAERDFHQRMIDMGIGDPKAHKAQLADLKLAEQALKNPSPRFKKALALTRQVVDQMEEIKVRDLGLSVETAQGRIAKAGQVLRAGEGFSPVTQRFANQIAKNPEGAVDEYVRRFGNVINTDLARELSPDYAKSNASRSRLAAAVHEPASALSKDAYKRLLAQPKERDGLVHFTAGGTGAGKTRAIGGDLAKSGDIVYDTNLNNFASSVEKIDQALESGRDVAIHYVYRSPVDSLVHGAIKRAKRMGRTVPLHEHVKTHVGSNDVIRKLVEKYAKDNRVQIHFLHNGNDGIVKIDLSQLPKLGYNEVANEVKAAYEAEYAAGRVPPAVHEGFSGQVHARNDRELAAGAARESGHGSPLLSNDSFYLPTQPRGKVKRPPSDRAGFYSPKAGPFGMPPGRDIPELTHEFTGKALQAGDYRIDATSLATEAYGRTVRAATVRAEHGKLWDAASAKPYGKFSIPIRDVNAIPDKLRQVVARLDEGDFGPKDAEVLPSDMRDLIESLYPDPKKPLTAEEIPHVRWIDARLLGEGNKMPHIPGSAAKVSQAIQGPFRVGVLYLRPAYILNKLGNHAMGVLDEGWMWPVNYVKALSMDSRYGAEATRTIHELVGAGKSRSYVASASGRFSQGLADFWNRVADRGERAAAFINYAERKGYKSKEEMNSLLFDPKNRADLNEVTRRANKSLVEFDNLLPIEKNYLRHFIFVYPWVSRSAVWSLRTIMEHPTQVDLLSHLGRDSEADPIFKNAPAWFKRTGYIPVGWNSDGTPRVVNPTSVNSFATLGDFLAFTKASTTGDKYASAEDFLGPLPKYLVHAVTGRDEFGNQYPGSQWFDAAKEVLLQLPQVSAYKKAGSAKKAPTKLPNVADRSSLETSLNANLHATVMSPGWMQGYGSLLAGGLSPRGVNTDALAARYWADQSPAKRHARELDLLNKALDIQAGVLKEKVPTSVRSAVRTQAEIDFQYKNFLKETGRAPTDKERAQFTIDYLAKQGSLKDAAKWKSALAPLADTADINRIKNTVLDKYANGKALRNWDTDIRTVASFTPEIMNQKAAELFKQGLSPQRKFNVNQDKLYDYGRKYVAFTREVRKMQDEGATPDQLRAFQDAHDKSVDGLPSFVRIAWANQTPEEQAQSTTAAAARSWRDNTAFEKALLGRPSDAKVTAGWAKLREIVATQSAQLKREGRSFPAGYERTLAKYVEKYYDAPGLVKDYDFASQPLVDRLKYLRPIQQSPNKDQWNQLLGLAHTYAKWLDAKNADGSRTYSALQVRQSWEDYISTPPFQAWLKQNPKFHAEIDNYGKSFLSSLVG